MSSVLPWRSSRQPWSGVTLTEKVAETLAALTMYIDDTTVWGGDWNQALEGVEYVGTRAGRRQLIGLTEEAGLSVLPGIISGLVGNYAGYRLSGRAARAAESRATRREAAADLGTPIRDLRSMTRRWGRVEVAQDFADDYLTYVLDAVVRWGEGERSARRLQDFDSWLKATDRRDPSPL